MSVDSYVVAMNRMRKSILEIAVEAQEGHIPSALSILDIVWVIYDSVLPGRRGLGKEHDRFVLSKGHGSLALYQVLAEKGVIDRAVLHTFCSYSSPLGGHPDRTKIPGVEASTGSLGHGLPIAVGMALGERIKESDGKVYVLIGDGESNEGTTWESALLAAHNDLSNLICIIDHNHSTDRALVVDPLVDKFVAFGWNAIEVDGHDPAKLVQLLSADYVQPTALVAHTVKGRGVPAMENNPAWHHGSPSRAELNEMLRSLS